MQHAIFYILLFFLLQSCLIEKQTSSKLKDQDSVITFTDHFAIPLPLGGYPITKLNKYTESHLIPFYELRDSVATTNPSGNLKFVYDILFDRKLRYRDELDREDFFNSWIDVRNPDHIDDIVYIAYKLDPRYFPNAKDVQELYPKKTNLLTN